MFTITLKVATTNKSSRYPGVRNALRETVSTSKHAKHIKMGIVPIAVRIADPAKDPLFRPAAVNEAVNEALLVKNGEMPPSFEM